MKIHSLHHTSFEGLGNILDWLQAGQHTLSSTQIWLNEPLPKSTEFDCLIVMGGSMSVNDEKEFPWLIEEKKFIESAIKSEKIVLGICLGAQLIATVLGAKVRSQPLKEIGWFPIKWQEPRHNFSRMIPSEFIGFHWHGESFDLPAGCQHLAYSQACYNQAFCYTDKVLALQFHPEVNQETLESMIDNCSNELILESTFVQSAEEIRQGFKHYKKTNQVLLNELLNSLLEK